MGNASLQPLTPSCPLTLPAVSLAEEAHPNHGTPEEMELSARRIKPIAVRAPSDAVTVHGLHTQSSGRSHLLHAIYATSHSQQSMSMSTRTLDPGSLRKSVRVLLIISSELKSGWY